MAADAILPQVGQPGKPYSVYFNIELDNQVTLCTLQLLNRRTNVSLLVLIMNCYPSLLYQVPMRSWRVTL